jgi:hypothetical protein
LSEETWADDVGALEFIKDLKRRKTAQIDLLIGAAQSSPDPSIRSNWAAIAQLDAVIQMMEAERGKPDDE